MKLSKTSSKASSQKVSVLFPLNTLYLLGLYILNLVIIWNQSPKQSPIDVLYKRCSEKFRKLHRIAPVPKCLFLIKFQAEAYHVIEKEILTQAFFNKTYQNSFFIEETSGVLSNSNLQNLSTLSGVYGSFFSLGYNFYKLIQLLICVHAKIKNML